MDFHILGPLEVLDEDRVVALGGPRQRALLALLLLHANETLGIDRLVDELWGARAPPTAAKTVQVQISRLRKSLHGGLDGGGVVVTREPGYELVVDPERIDAHHFERLVAEAEREQAAGRPEAATAALDRALGLWRGGALADVAYEQFAQPEIARLDDLRASALELQIDAELALGRHAGVVGRLPALIAEHPYRERLHGHLMLALYRCDRQADALQAFQEARRLLVGELGIEPGERLRELERAVLAQDPALALQVAAEPAPPAAGEPAAPLGRTRRLVSVVFVEIAGAAALAERLDPEPLHAVLDRCAEVCAEVLERHGGTVEHVTGDAAIGIFGLPVLHEDDALRAARAALELGEAIAALGVQLERDHGVRVAARLGIESGEVFAGAGTRREPFATGDAMSVAAGLQAAASPGEILLGERAQRLVAPHVEANALEPIAVRGRGAAVRAWRLLALRGREPGSPSTRLIGRELELAELRASFERVRRERACRLVTIIGPPGIGKSRLTREWIAALAGEATVAVGRCVSYGEGITYRPLAEIVGALGRGDPRRAIAEHLAGEEQAQAITPRVLGAIGLADESAQPDETFWAIRRLFEAAARRGPLVVVVDDAHWAEPTLLDLLDSVAAFSSGAPILIVCLARPELLERRPGWAAPHPSRSLLVLEALSGPDAQALVEALAGAAVEPSTTARIVETAEGNPLFLEHLTAASTEQRLEALPPTIEAVLAARIDRLEPGERAVLAHASVEGRSFHGGALAAMVADSARDAVAPALMGLVRKQLIHPDPPVFAGEDGFRFAHALIGEVAYAGLPKRLRADLHERLARWLRTKPRVDELLGHHLEQAYRHRLEVGCAGEHDRALAAEGSERLAAAARAALTRGDAAAAARLLERAAALVPAGDDGRPALLATLGAALVEAGRLADADGALAEAIERAEEHGHARVASRARVEQQLARLRVGASAGLDQARRVADTALARRGDDFGRSRAWCLRAWIEWTESNAARADEAWGRAAAHARRAGEERDLFEILGWQASAAVFGPQPVPEAIRRCERIREQVRSSPVAVAVTLHPLGLLHAMTGQFELARRLIREGNEILDELGRMESAVSHPETLVELLAGRPAAAEARLRPGYETLERMGERALLATTAVLLAAAVYAQDRLDEADDLCRVSESIAAREDLATQVMWRGVRAKIRARRGDLDAAEALGQEAVRLAEPTDLLVVRGDALLDLAEVERIAGRPAEAETATRGGIELYERKGNLVSAARARSWAGAAAPA